jgi:hypothetical protein
MTTFAVLSFGGRQSMLLHLVGSMRTGARHGTASPDRSGCSPSWGAMRTTPALVIIINEYALLPLVGAMTTPSTRAARARRSRCYPSSGRRGPRQQVRSEARLAVVVTPLGVMGTTASSADSLSACGGCEARFTKRSRLGRTSGGFRGVPPGGYSETTPVPNGIRGRLKFRVELRGFEPLTFCMPWITISSDMVSNGLVSAGQRRCVVWGRRLLSAEIWGRCHLICH